MPLPKMSTSGDQKTPHLALLPSSGMGHLAPSSRLAATLCDRGCVVSFITAHPTVTSAESLHVSHLLSSFPKIRPLHLPLAPLDRSAFPSTTDPFLLRFEAIRRSAHLLPPLLATASLTVSALIVDISLASAFIPVAAEINLPCYILSLSSTAMLSLCAFFPTYIATKTTPGIGDIDIPGLWTIPKTSIMSALHNPNSLFATQFIQNGRILQKADGILVNTFKALEPEVLAALNGGHVMPGLPPVITIGPLRQLQSGGHSPLPWLDRQPARSVVYVGFGNRSALTRQQIKELGVGLEKSGWRFLWVVKTKIVDREEEEEEEEEELEELLGDGFLERVKERGLVVKGWVEQEEVLSHGAVGGFVSHCGSASVTEAALFGVRILGWPRGGDQRVNGEVVRRSGLGIWVEEWSWEAEEEVVSGEEIAKRVKEMMEDEGLQRSAERVMEEAVRAIAVGGSSDKGLEEFIGKLKV